MSLPCDEVERAIPWFLDDELEADLSLEIEAHIGECAACCSVLEREGQLRVTLRRAASKVAAPSALRRSVRDAIENERQRTNTFVRAWPAAAAAAVLMAFIWSGSSGGGEELEWAADRHARELPMDVVAADVMQVQNYFNGKLPFAVRLPQLPPTAFKAMGGRVTHMRDKDAAYVRYDTPRGRMSVFVYQDADEDFPEVAPGYQLGNRRMMVKQVRGYTVAKWQSAGLTYSVVTDLPEQEFSSILRATLP